ncbi:hypothetical protein ABZ371_32420, partial [Streptomyces sp. NPDC005899]
MTVQQQADAVGEFARHLRGLATRLDPGQGWYGVFCARDPHGMRACFDGTEIPPWDVVASLLQDLAVLCGTPYAAQESERVAALYAASVRAYDGRPGGRQALVDRLALMVREQAYAERRLRSAGPGEAPAEAMTPEARARAWDDHTRATARCAELRSRLGALGSAGPELGYPAGSDSRVPEPGGTLPHSAPTFPDPSSTFQDTASALPHPAPALPHPAPTHPAGPRDDGGRRGTAGLP